MTVPHRIQLRRVRGWRKPPGAVSCGRPGKWGNQFATAAEFRAWAMAPEQAGYRASVKLNLRGKVLACWCRLDADCHVDVLLEVANG